MMTSNQICSINDIAQLNTETDQCGSTRTGEHSRPRRSRVVRELPDLSMKQSLQTTMKDENSKNLSKQTRSSNLKSISSASFVDMTFNSRNAEFETTNTEILNEENNSQEIISTDDQISNQSSNNSRNNENISDAAFFQAQRMKIADIVVVALRMN
jgi:hypothetical protein